MIFKDYHRARGFFSNDIDIEACEKCGCYSASNADDWEHGEIVSAHCDYDRICLKCDEEEANL